jgi:diguanylate cyclase (GGDEF)-like protein/PAS domain S-box-containing protein
MNQVLNELTQAIPGVVYQFRVNPDGSWQFCYLSEGIRELYELSPEEVYADQQVLIQCILEVDRVSHRASVELATQNCSPWMHEHRICTPGGKFKWIRGQALPSPQDDGSVLWNGILIDITDSKKTELQLLRLQKIYTAVLKADKLISRTRILPEAFQGICKIAVELGGMKMAWIGIPDAINDRILPVASYGEGTRYLDNIFISLRADVPEGHGPVGTSFIEQRTVLKQDFQGDSIIEPWLEPIKAYGWGSVASFPVQRCGEAYAVLAVYSAEKNAFDDEIVSLLEELAADIGHAVDRLDSELERQEMARRHKQSEEIYQTLFQTVHQGVVYQNPIGQIMTANFAAESILGLSLDQMLGVTSVDPIWGAIHPDGTPFPGETHPAMVAIQTGKPVHNVVMGINSPSVNHTVWININANPIFKEGTNELDYVYSTFDDISKQLQWEASLQESEQRFRSLANAAPVLMWIADTNKDCIWFNDTWLGYTGRTREQEHGNGWTDGVHPDDFLRCLETYISHFDARQAFSMEYRLRGSDGEYHWFIDVGKPRFDELGEFCGYIGMLTDINERKKLEETMRFYQFSLSHVSEEIFWVGKNGAILDVNQAACAKLGYSEAEIKQLKVADIDPRFTVDKWQEHWLHLKQEKNLRFESIHKMRNGKIYPIEIFANYFEYGGKEFICAFARDITEQKAFERRLKEKTDYLNTILNSEPECVKVLASDGSLLDMNQAGLDMLQVASVADVREYGLINFVLPEFRAPFQQLHEDVFQGKTATLEFILSSKHGIQHWVDTHAAPLYDENGKVKALVAVTRDITEQVRLLKELENQARKDFLTGLPNRRYFLELAEQEFLRTQRYNNPLSVLMMDIDFFKSVNDRYGHKAGDLVLQKLASVCIGILRKVDVIGRMGGEEFAVLLPETPGSYAIEVAERIRQALENAEVIIEQQPAPLRFNVSIGVTTINSHKTSIDKMLQEADAALYQAKNTGRNKVVALF